ncbi:hypothetical protein BRYFOR_08579 [Marvinbryantia formatexigens DSM 14469]|uniref:Uncharacterized protein n=1 Tax=Marvinbryantia formatexigens DSM 14469 TaxID=478749 RepID=C6LIU9_9FIRM|nr:hypothetical protein [Marvinbryantia formatexigens]EET59488.1 hypothetical protein BRYFOR_08579 [Marvinbryantia formatexigens DSM 14469]UWO24034.1 hypothetical protein NQ534_16550 [Marvinbryantia formatexigens DSM 14469]SDG65891.1 hypothetical protein SAMN05660368_03012 [Marvinbryantia formatexigens]
MDYEKLLSDIGNTSKETMKKVIFELDQRHARQIKEMGMDEETTKEIVLMLKDRTFFEMLIINAFMSEH